MMFADHALTNPWWVDVFLAPVLAILATILIFMDQQITAVIVNRKEHKLKKGGGYHLDLLVSRPVRLLTVKCTLNFKGTTLYVKDNLAFHIWTPY